jgi:cobalamin synthase
MKQSKEYKKPWWMWIIIVVFGLMNLVDSPILGIITIAIWFACGNQCVTWATKLKKSQNWAFFIGYVFGLLGLLVYWIFNRADLKRLSK